MGKPIVYCVGCGNSLRENDFDEGGAINHDNRPYCENCKPKNLTTESPSKQQPAPTSPPRKTSTARIPTQRPTTQRKMSGGRMPRDQQTDRRRPVPVRRSNLNWPLIIGGITLAVAFILLLLVVVFRRERPGTQPPVDPPAPTQKP